MDPAATIRVSGDLDFTTAPTIAATLAHRVMTSSGPVTIDCRGLGFTDSTGISVLVECWRSLQRDGRPLRLIGVPDELRRLLELTGLTEHLGVKA